jgi:hypothetical protein
MLVSLCVEEEYHGRNERDDDCNDDNGPNRKVAIVRFWCV